MSPLLSVQNLKTRFHTPEGTVYAVNGISYDLNEGETLAVVGEAEAAGAALQAIPPTPRWRAPSGPRPTAAAATRSGCAMPSANGSAKHSLR